WTFGGGGHGSSADRPADLLGLFPHRLDLLGQLGELAARLPDLLGHAPPVDLLLLLGDRYGAHGAVALGPTAAEHHTTRRSERRRHQRHANLHRGAATAARLAPGLFLLLASLPA